MQYNKKVGYMTIDIICKDFLEPLLKSQWHRDNNPLYGHYTNVYQQYKQYLSQKNGR